MKLLFAIHGLPVGGAEHFLVQLVNYFNRTNISTSVVVLGGDTALMNSIDEGVELNLLKKKTRLDLNLIKQYREIIVKVQPQRIICINTYALCLTRIALFGLRVNIQLYLSPHTTIPFSFYSRIRTWVHFRFLSKRDTVLYLSVQQKNYLRTAYQLISHPHFIIPNGVNINLFSPDTDSSIISATIRRRYGLSADSKIIVIVARISPEKGFEDAIEALDLLHAMGENSVHLLVVGGGDEHYTKQLLDLVEQKELNSFIHIIGSHSDVRPFLKAANLFTLCSWSETFPLSALEAMSIGLPMVLTDVGAANEILGDDPVGLLIPPKRPAELALMWKTALHMEWDNEGIRHAAIRRFSIDRMFDSYKRILIDHISESSEI